MSRFRIALLGLRHISQQCFLPTLITSENCRQLFNSCHIHNPCRNNPCRKLRSLNLIINPRISLGLFPSSRLNLNLSQNSRKNTHLNLNPSKNQRRHQQWSLTLARDNCSGSGVVKSPPLPKTFLEIRRPERRQPTPSQTEKSPVELALEVQWLVLSTA